MGVIGIRKSKKNIHHTRQMKNDNDLQKITHKN
jgi:hypothetical protein